MKKLALLIPAAFVLAGCGTVFPWGDPYVHAPRVAVTDARPADVKKKPAVSRRGRSIKRRAIAADPSGASAPDATPPPSTARAAAAEAAGPKGKPRKPRKHWWQVWRPKP